MNEEKTNPRLPKPESPSNVVWNSKLMHGMYMSLMDHISRLITSYLGDSLSEICRLSSKHIVCIGYSFSMICIKQCYLVFKE